MPTTLNEINERRGKLVKQAQDINNKAKDEKRDMTAQEAEQFDKLMDEHDKLDITREQLMKDAKRERWLSDQSQSRGRETSPDKPGENDPSRKGGRDEVRTVAWGDNFTTKREIRLSGRTASDEYRELFEQYLMTGERRDLQADLATAGGFLALPQQMVAELIKFVDNNVYIRQKATVMTVTNADTLGAPSLDNDIADDDWTAEIATGSADTSMTFGKRELKPHPSAKRIKVSNTLLRKATIGPEQLVTQRLGYKKAVTEEKAYMLGTGANQPLGLFVASAQGISTARDVNTSNTTTSITADGLINAKYALKEAHQAAAEWIFHRDAIKQIRTLKDGLGQYLWQPGLAGGQPNAILDRPYSMSEYAPNTFTTGQYVGLIGNLKWYWIADALSLQIQRLSELYAEANQTGFIARFEVDGAPVLEEAFARVTLS